MYFLFESNSELSRFPLDWNFSPPRTQIKYEQKPYIVNVQEILVVIKLF